MSKKTAFDQPAYADLRLVLLSSQGGNGSSSDLAGDSPRAKRRCLGLPSDDLRSFYTHKVILASSSPVISAMLEKAKELRDHDATRDGLRVRLLVSPPAGGGLQTDPQLELLELPVELEEMLACEVLCRSIYSGDLVEEVRSATSSEQGAGVCRVTLLVQVYRLADRLEVCTDQCAQAISALSSADFKSIDVVNNVFSLKRTAPLLVEHATIKFLRKKCLAYLHEHFGSMRELFGEKDVMKEFKQLDFLTVLAFLDSDQLVVDSENEVLTLMGAWMGEDWADRSKEQLEAFWNILCLGHLTTSFISKLAAIAPWLPVDHVVLGDAAAWKSFQFKSPIIAATMQKKLQSAYGGSVAWFRDGRPTESNGAFFNFCFNQEDLAKLLTSVQDAGAQEDLHTIRAADNTYNGYDFVPTLSVKVLSDGSKKQFVLSVGFEFGVSAFLSKGSQALVHVKAQCLHFKEDTLQEVCLGKVDDVLDGTHAWELTRVGTLEDFSCLNTWLYHDGQLSVYLVIGALD